jgi:hypothetical protein
LSPRLERELLGGREMFFFELDNGGRSTPPLPPPIREFWKMGGKAPPGQPLMKGRVGFPLKYNTKNKIKQTHQGMRFSERSFI